MAIFRNVHVTFWTDTKVVDDFTPEDKYFYVYLLTNPHTNLCGCYEVSMKQMSDELGYNKETIEKMIDRFHKIHSVIDYNPKTKEMLIYNWSKYNWTKSPKLQAALSKEIPKVKCPEFRDYLDGILNGDEVEIPYAYGMDTPDTDTVTDTDIYSDISNKKKKKTFVPPTLEEVEAYCKERKNNVDAKRFYDYFNASEWVDSKGKKVRNWKQKVITWEGYATERNETNGQTSGHTGEVKRVGNYI